MLKRFAQRLQVWLYFMDCTSLAHFIGKFTGEPEPTAAPFLLKPRPIAPVMYTTDDITMPKPLKVLEFDPHYVDNSTRDIDVSKDVAWPVTKYDVN